VSVLITGIGWVGSLGAGRSGDEGSPRYGAGTLANPIAKVRLKDYFATSEGRSGRLDDYSKTGLAAVALALRDAGLDRWEEKRPGAIIAATEYGCLATDGDYFETVLPEGGALASPNLFAYTLPNCFVGEAALRFGLTGPTYVVSGEGGASSGVEGLVEALAVLQEGHEGQEGQEGAAEFVVCGFCDLGAPAFMARQEDSPAGALFLVLERGDQRIGEARALATLSLKGSEVLLEGSVPVVNLIDLVSGLTVGNSQR
jgi:3-oxoacyl-[acyl-carrier-protein] synthase II